MTSDTERRDVARRLREVNPYRNQSYTVPYNRYTRPAEYLSELAGALGFSSENDVSRLEFQSRLADLIEPSCDRDALLALAEELDGLGLTGFSSGWSSGSVNVGSFARRIRKALVVSNDA